MRLLLRATSSLGLSSVLVAIEESWPMMSIKAWIWCIIVFVGLCACLKVSLESCNNSPINKTN